MLAGAGSGKTQVITSRIVHLLKGLKVPAENILAVTFTNKAAKEMQERVSAAAGSSSKGMIISTFHSLGVRILRHDIRHLGYKPNFSIYTESDQAGVLRQAMRDIDLDPKQFNPDSIKWRISLAKNRLTGPEEYNRNTGDPMDSATALVYSRYQLLLRAFNAIDFDDIIMLAVHLLETIKETRKYWQQRFRYLMVDEYQDTNACQLRLIHLLSETHGNLCVVGDDDQSIYGWRGAEVKNILSFEEQRPGCRVIKLEQNYRSTGTILSAANSVIRNNLTRSDKALWTASGNGDAIQIIVADDEESEARQVVEQLHLAQYQEKRLWSDFAILYRGNAQSRTFEQALQTEGIPYLLVGGMKFFERKEVKDTLAYLAVLANPDDEASLLRILNFPRRGIGDNTLLHLNQWSMEKNIGLFDSLGRVNQIEGISEAAKKAVTKFHSMLAAEMAAFRPEQMAEQSRNLFRRLGINEELYRTMDDPAQAQKRIENIEQVVNSIASFEERHPGRDLSAFIERISLLEDSRRDAGDEKESAQDAVTLMSLHASKGLEFPHVFLVGMEEGLLPHHRSIDEDPDVAEERRLCYVGITRARERLTVSRTLTRRKYGTREERFPSRFISEIPPELLEGGEAEASDKKSADMGNDFFSRMLADDSD